MSLETEVAELVTATTIIQVPGMNASFTTQVGSTLTLVGKSNGQWMEVSRSF